jgi:hypothetical protein
MLKFRASRMKSRIDIINSMPPPKETKAPKVQPLIDTSMKNLVVWIKKTFDAKHGSTYVFNGEKDSALILGYLRSQIDNSLRLGWKPQNLFVVTNFKFEHRKVQAVQLNDVHEDCSFVNKWTALRMLWKHGVKGDFWFHDADAFQLTPFTVPGECKDIGFVRYAKGVQGGSVFFRESGKDLLNHLIQQSKTLGVANDEDVFWKMAFDPEMGKRITWLNPTYNVGRTGWLHRYKNAEKPVRVIHLKPHERWRRYENMSANAFLTPPDLQDILRKNGIWNPEN